MKNRNILKKHNLKSQQRLIVFIAMFGLIVFNIIFFLIPLLWGIIGSFHDWNPILNVTKFIGFENYKKIFMSPIFKTSAINSLIFTTVAVVFRTVLGLLLAVGLLSITKYRDWVRSFYFLPVIMPIVAVSLVWKWIYNPRIGLLNTILLAFGIAGPNWLADTALALPSVLAMVVWKDVGYAIIIFIAGLLNIPKVYYDAANVDGASSRQQFFYITLPLINPTVIFIVITSLISYFQSFVQIFIMTKGGPGGATSVISYLIFQEAFKKYRFGYASALSVILFIIILIITLIGLRVVNKER